MTVNAAASSVVLYGNGTTTTWPFTFKLLEAGDLKVSLVDANGAVTSLASTQYNLTFDPDNGGGSVTYPLSGTPLALNNKIIIRRFVAYEQTADLVNQGKFYPEVIEGGLDNLAMQIQQLSQEVSSSLKYPSSEQGDTTQSAFLPSKTSRASRNAVFDSNGNITFGDLTTGFDVTATVTALLAAEEAKRKPFGSALATGTDFDISLAGLQGSTFHILTTTGALTQDRSAEFSVGFGNRLIVNYNNGLSGASFSFSDGHNWADIGAGIITGGFYIGRDTGGGTLKFFNGTGQTLQTFITRVR